MNRYNRLSESVSRAIVNGWEQHDSKVIQTFSEIFEKQLLNQLSKFSDKLNLICVPDGMTELPEYTYNSNNDNSFNLNKSYQLGLLLLTFKCYKLAVLNYRMVRLNGENFPSISDIYLDYYNHEEFNNLALFINGLSDYEKLKNLKSEKIDVLGMLHLLNNRKLLNIHTNFFMFIDRCIFMNDPKDSKDIVRRGIYKFYLSKSINAYDIFEFIYYLSDESIKELEKKFNEEAPEEKESEDDFEESEEESEEESTEELDSQLPIESYKNESDELRKINEKLKKKIQKLKNKEQELDDILQKKRKLVKGLDAAIERRINQLNKKLPEGHIPI